MRSIMSTFLFIRRGRLAEFAQTAFIEKFGLRRKFEALTCAILLHLPFVQIQTKESRVKWNVQILVIRTKHHLFVVNQQIHSRRKNLRHFFSPKACQLLPPLEEAAPAWIILAMVIVTMQLESNNWYNIMNNNNQLFTNLSNSDHQEAVAVK